MFVKIVEKVVENSGTDVQAKQLPMDVRFYECLRTHVRQMDAHLLVEMEGRDGVVSTSLPIGGNFAVYLMNDRGETVDSYAP